MASDQGNDAWDNSQTWRMTSQEVQIKLVCNDVVVDDAWDDSQTWSTAGMMVGER